MRKLFLFFCLSALLMALPLSAEEKKKDTRNVMLNAESATVPREINIGLPESGNGAVVYVDGLKHAQGLPRSQFHWSGGNAYEPISTIGLMEAVVRCGEFGVLVDSHTRFGRDTLSGAVTLQSSSNGLIRFDGAINGRLAKVKTGSWHFSLGAYVNYDPTNVNAPSRLFVDQKQIYQASLTRKWNNGMSLSGLYRFSLCDDRVDGGYSVAPFVFVGDGSIRQYGNFRLGRDCYMPADENVRWMDLVTGTMQEGNMAKMDRRLTHDATLKWQWEDAWESGWKLDASWHLCHIQPSRYLKVTLAGIDLTTPTGGYTRPDGSPFEGYIQQRQTQVVDTWTSDHELLFTAEKKWNKHLLKLGLDLVCARQYDATSSFIFAHSVEPSPIRLQKNGVSSWSLNRNSLYLDAWKLTAAIYAFHNWDINDRIRLRTGARINPIYNDVNTAARLSNEETKNVRVDGFNLADPNLAEIHHIQKPYLNYVVSENLSWRIVNRLFFTAEGFYSMTEKTSTYFRNAKLPSLAPIGNALVRAGFNYDNSWMDCTALFSYITSWNNAATISVTKQIGGISETIPYTAQYGIGTLGFTLDGNFHVSGFNLHARLTLQDPRYKNYGNVFEFSDGSQMVIDYSGKLVTGISRLMIEFDPSYSWDWCRVWASVRYNSRQYASRTNLAYFNGHFETFAGADFTSAKHHKISLNLVNVLFQTGAKGSIDIADTITDPAQLQDLVMAGSYIRPFTAELSYTWKF